ncbi:MAG: purine-nucleoside phosphorylase [Ruminococcaceae bacterium]|nr:purine-nucleoside phosphorylase [Oscillospiraceae bacterium]MBR3597651.1 purine-nucleoside phosphorylase [Clostridia bacterium]
MQKLDFEFFSACAEYVKNIINDEPEVGIILGSGLKDFSKRIIDPVVIPYEKIPNFLVSTVESHEGKLIFGSLQGKKIICMSGRFHHYEGYPFEMLTLPVRLFKLLGVKKTIITNAAGAVNESYRPGDIMIIKDHLKLTGASPLQGDNIPEFGPRFFDTTDMYTKELREKALLCAKGSTLNIHEGVYMYFTGPQFETPAEIRAARILGADAVGMSTVTEALTAAHCSMPLLGLSVMTNMAAGILDKKLTDEEVGETAAMISGPFGDYVERIIGEI